MQIGCGCSRRKMQKPAKKCCKNCDLFKATFSVVFWRTFVILFMNLTKIFNDVWNNVMYIFTQHVNYMLIKFL